MWTILTVTKFLENLFRDSILALVCIANISFHLNSLCDSKVPLVNFSLDICYLKSIFYWTQVISAKFLFSCNVIYIFSCIFSSLLWVNFFRDRRYSIFTHIEIEIKTIRQIVTVGEIEFFIDTT